MNTPNGARLRLLGVAACVTLALLVLGHLGTSPAIVERIADFRYPQHHGNDTASRDLLDDTMNRTLGFQKIFVINLPHRTDLADVITMAAEVTGLDVEIVDGVYGANVSRKALPFAEGKDDLNAGSIGCWRAHMDLARRIVKEHIQSALILEADSDWDIRIKAQMRDFARASRILLQPLVGTNDSFLDPTYPAPQAWDPAPEFDVEDEVLARVTPPTSSPYADLDRWDLLWLGHCGTRFPWASDENTPLGRAAIRDDKTVPALQHYNPQLGDMQLQQLYPSHTRVVSRARQNTCTFGYAFSQRGARHFLYELGIRSLDGPVDNMMQRMCDGKEGRPQATCLVVQPQLFQTHRPRGPKASESDINDHGSGYNEHAESPNIRWSTRINMDKLLAGETSGFRDLYPDNEYTTHWAEEGNMAPASADWLDAGAFAQAEPAASAPVQPAGNDAATEAKQTWYPPEDVWPAADPASQHAPNIIWPARPGGDGAQNDAKHPAWLQEHRDWPEAGVLPASAPFEEEEELQWKEDVWDALEG